MADNNATVGVRARKLPIVIVPGTMGSRLQDPATGDLVWNPLGFPFHAVQGQNEAGVFAANLKRLEEVNRPLVGATDKLPVVDEVKVSHIRHFHTVIRKFYGGLALKLAATLKVKLASQNIFPIVYCAGYDFRVDNARSALTLKQVVDEAQAECDGEQVTIIAHSMGGLVTRSFCKNLGGEKQVKRVFLVASPTHGAPDAYFTLRNGFEFGIIRILIFGDIFRATDSRAFALKMPSVYQLLPTDLYSRADARWLSFDKAFTGMEEVDGTLAPTGVQFSDVSNLGLLYTDLLTGVHGTAVPRESVGALLGAAFSFDETLKTPTRNTYFHPNTTVLFCNDMSTVTGGEVRTEGLQELVQGHRLLASFAVDGKTKAGDETVPAISANPAFTDPPPKLQQAFSGVTHQQLPANGKVIDFLIEQIVAAP
jgi:pimeloyl-ACP methyl ester carboxylesterase